MSASSSPYRESRLNKPERLLRVVLVTTSFFYFGCRLTPKTQSAQSSVANAGVTALSARDLVSQWFKPEPVVQVVDDSPGKKEIARLMVSSCRNPGTGSIPFLSRWELDLETPFGSRPVRFSVSRYGMKVLVRSYLGDESTEFISPSMVPDEWMRGACSRISESAGSPVVASKEVVDAISGWLSGFAPDCNSTLQPASATTAGWKCQPSTPESWATLVDLENTRHSMISGWTRQPYLLARRIAIGVSIASALQEAPADQDPRPSLKKACAVIRRSLKAELPLVLDDPRVIDTFCGDLATTQAARSMAGTVAAKIALEAGALREIFENTSKSGSVTVSLPPPDESGTSFLVTLKPQEDVVLGLAKFTQAMLIERQINSRSMARRRASAEPENPVAGSADVSQDPGSVLGYACWHPLFEGSHQRLLIAQELGLLASPVRGAQGEGACAGREGPGSGGDQAVDVRWTPQRYVAESITSDTEFLVTNGETKTLRLPAGTYAYTVQILQQVPSAIEDSAMPAAPIAEGRIEWLAPKPRAVIKDPAAG